jgi:hypothetical protein
VIFLDCAGESVFAMIGAQGPVFSLLRYTSFGVAFGGSGLFDRCKAFFGCC